MKKFYRVCKPNEQGLWYNPSGEFTGLIHTEYKFCTNSNLQMDFDEELVGWLSATDNLEDLKKWFPPEDIESLSQYGFAIYEYDVEDFKFYEKFQHYIINQKTSKISKIVTYENEPVAID